MDKKKKQQSVGRLALEACGKAPNEVKSHIIDERKFGEARKLKFS